MEYQTDLLKQKRKTKLGLVLGILSFIVAISWILIRLTEKNTISAFDWFYSFLFFLNGLSQIMIGFGYSIERIVGKAFVSIDEKLLKIKLSVFSRELSLNWDEIKSINYRTNNYVFSKNDGSNYSIKIGKLDYSTIQDIKKVIKEIAERKDIIVTE